MDELSRNIFDILWSCSSIDSKVDQIIALFNEKETGLEVVHNSSLPNGDIFEPLHFSDLPEVGRRAVEYIESIRGYLYSHGMLDSADKALAFNGGKVRVKK